MSTATAFKYHRPFPFCPSAPSLSVYGYDVVDNLSLETVMAFFWNLESVSFTFAGTATMMYERPHEDPLYYYTYATGTVGVVTPQATGDFSHLSIWSYGGAMLPYAASCAFADLPTTATPPRSRVCEGSSVLAIQADWDWPTTATPEFPTLFRVNFIVRTDPARSDKFAIEYRVDVMAGSYYIGGTPGRLGWSNPSNVSTASDPPYIVNSGNFTIGGISFPYVCYGNVSAYPTTFTFTGGTMSATSSAYTY